MKNMSTFQLVILGVFGFSVILALFLFSTQDPKTDDSKIEYGEVLVWGTLPERSIRSILNDIDLNIKIDYVQKTETGLQQEIYRAPFSNKKTPDLVILPMGEYLNYRIFLRELPKFQDYPELAVSERDFMSTFIEQAEMYIEQNGIYALPIVVDPMVMYWNRSIFASNAVSEVPDEWDDFKLLVPKMALVGDDTSIKRSVLPFGEYVNVTHVKDIVSMLIMQLGAPVVDADRGKLTVNVNDPIESVYPGKTALEFFMEFSNQSLPTYNWNRSLPTSKDMFVAGDSAVYFGYASEIPEIEKTNPHLNFDVAMVPQKRGSDMRLTYGKMVGIGLLDSSRNQFGAMKVISLLSGAHGSIEYPLRISEGLKLPPTHRALLSSIPDDVHMSVFYEAANVSSSWPDPASTQTDRVFETAIEGLLSNRFQADVAITTLERQLEQIITEYEKENRDI